MDARNRYRIRTVMHSYGEMFRVQVRRWWWPFWTGVNFAASEDRAREYAENHASIRRYRRRTINIGRLPAGRNN